MTLRAALAAAKHEIERQMITDALRRTEGNRTQAAKQLGVSRRTLQLRLAVYRRDGQ